MDYCELKISRQAIQILAATGGNIPTTFNEALRDIQKRDALISETVEIANAVVGNL